MSSADDLSYVDNEDLRRLEEDLRNPRSKTPYLALIYPRDQHYLMSGL